MNAEFTHDLQAHLTLCRDILSVTEGEGRLLRHPETPSMFELYQRKKDLLPRLTESLDRLRKHREIRQAAGAGTGTRPPEIEALLRQNQDLIMKIIVLDRENEQALLRRGLVPARELPSVNRQRPHFVADLYRRRGG